MNKKEAPKPDILKPRQVWVPGDEKNFAYLAIIAVMLTGFTLVVNAFVLALTLFTSSEQTAMAVALTLGAGLLPLLISRIVWILSRAWLAALINSVIVIILAYLGFVPPINLPAQHILVPGLLLGFYLSFIILTFETFKALVKVVRR